MITLTFGILCKAHIHGRFAICLMNVIDALKEYAVETQIYVGRSNLPVARSELLTKWWRQHKSGDLFFFLDADHTFTVGDIRSIIALNADIRCGIYANSEGVNTAAMVDAEGFYEGRDNRILLAGCGLMCISWDIIDRISKRLPPVYQSLEEDPIYPFFQPIFVKYAEKQLWLSEDKSFCQLVRENGGILRGFSSPTIGHEVYKIETL
jgi:hypothetical protein